MATGGGVFRLIASDGRYDRLHGVCRLPGGAPIPITTYSNCVHELTCVCNISYRTFYIGEHSGVFNERLYSDNDDSERFD